MLVTAQGEWFGAISGGCIEEDVALRAREVLCSSEPTIVRFDLRQRHGCHGKIHILIERVHEDFIVALTERRANRETCLAWTNLRPESGPVRSRILEVSAEQARTAGWPDSFCQKLAPALRVLICGDGPAMEPLKKFCGLLGWPVVNLPDPALPSVTADQYTAAVIESHNYGRDFITLQKLLPMNLRYVGLIGSRRRREQLLHDLADHGTTVRAGLYSPAGLDLGSEGPDEIALAIVAEIQRVFAGGSAVSLGKTGGNMPARMLAVEL